MNRADMVRSDDADCESPATPSAGTSETANNARPTQPRLDVEALDRTHIWHPYSSMVDRPPMLAVESASGVRLKLSDGRELIDAMSSWWCAIHGYNHPQLNDAAHRQLQSMAHVMFGGLTHEPAVTLGQQLLRAAPRPWTRSSLLTPDRYPSKSP